MKKGYYPKINNKILNAVNGVINFAINNKKSNLYGNLPKTPLSSLGDFEKLPKITTARLRKPDLKLAYYPEIEVRYLVSEFDSTGIKKLFLLPQRTDAIWRALDEEIKSVKPGLLISILPFFWQLGPMFYKTLLQNKIPAIALPPRNLPVAREVIDQVGVKGVIATPNSADELNDLVKKYDPAKQIILWHIMLPLNGVSVFNPGDNSLIFLEKQIMPGIPAGYQCEYLARKKSDKFHPSKEFLWEFENEKATVTSLKKDALPFIRYKLDCRATIENESCLCGENLIVDFF